MSINCFELLVTKFQVVPIDDLVVQCHSLIAGKLSNLRNWNEIDGK